MQEQGNISHKHSLLVRRLIVLAFVQTSAIHAPTLWTAEQKMSARVRRSDTSPGRHENILKQQEHQRQDDNGIRVFRFCSCEVSIVVAKPVRKLAPSHMTGFPPTRRLCGSSIAQWIRPSASAERPQSNTDAGSSHIGRRLSLSRF